MHVLYELEPYLKAVIDPVIEQQLLDNKGDVSLRQLAVDQAELTIEEYRSEHKVVQQAAAQFAVFLKKHAMATHNDATLAYLDMLIRDEEAKIAAGGKKQRLIDLQEDRDRHIELTNTLLSLTNGDSAEDGVLDNLEDEQDVARLESELYGLKHFGQNLRDVKNGIAQAHEVTNRERPHHVRKKAAGSGRPSLRLQNDGDTSNSFLVSFAHSPDT
jgi:hypothetical protein